MAKGRPAGLHLSFGEAYQAACIFCDYWWRIDGLGQVSVWRGETHLGIVRTETAARVRIVRDFEAICKGGPGYAEE